MQPFLVFPSRVKSQMTNPVAVTLVTGSRVAVCFSLSPGPTPPSLRGQVGHALAHLPEAVGVVEVGRLVVGELDGAVGVVEAGLLGEAGVGGHVEDGLHAALGGLEPGQPAEGGGTQAAAAQA